MASGSGDLQFAISEASQRSYTLTKFRQIWHALLYELYRGNFLDLEPGTRLESSTKMSSSILRNALSLGLSPGHLDPVIPESRADFSSNLKSPMVLWLSMGTTKFCSREENFSSFVIMTHSNVGISSTTRSYGSI